MKICPAAEKCDYNNCQHRVPHNEVWSCLNVTMNSCPSCIEYEDSILFTCPIHGKYDSTRHPSKGCHFCIDNGITIEVDMHERTSSPVRIQTSTYDAQLDDSQFWAKVSHLALTLTNEEEDPNGIKPNEPGAKLDAGKLQAGLLSDFSLALQAVAEVSTFGAKKYSRGGWQHVPNGEERYYDAMWRHLLQERHEDIDPDSGLLHEAHRAWNVLAKLELRLRREKK